MANIYLNELDQFIEQRLIPEYTQGVIHQPNPAYSLAISRAASAWKEGNRPEYRKWQKEKRRIPSVNKQDPSYRRLRYVRYADDFILGFVGPKVEAETIKARINDFLAQELHLRLSEEKTLLTNASEEKARFLGYHISVAKADSYQTDGRRTVNRNPILQIPREVVTKWKRKVTRKGHTIHRADLIEESDYEIVLHYQVEFQGLVNYYGMAQDVGRLNELKWAYMHSLAKTLAKKHKTSVRKIIAKHKVCSEMEMTAFQVVVPREGQKPLIAQFGGMPIRYQKKSTLSDRTTAYFRKKSELVSRLLARRCELCGTEYVPLEGHHVSKLKDLAKRFKSRKEPPRWVVRMIKRRRKCLMVCENCHKAIHTGTYDGPKLTSRGE